MTHLRVQDLWGVTLQRFKNLYLLFAWSENSHKTLFFSVSQTASCWQELDGWLFSSRMFKWKFTIKAAVFEKTDLGIVVWSYLEFSSMVYASLLPPRPPKDSLRYCLFSCVAVRSAWERREEKQSCCIWLGEVDLRWNACCHYVCWQFMSPAKLIFAPRHAGTSWVFASSMLCLKLLCSCGYSELQNKARVSV